MCETEFINYRVLTGFELNANLIVSLCVSSLLHELIIVFILFIALLLSGLAASLLGRHPGQLLLNDPVLPHNALQIPMFLVNYPLASRTITLFLILRARIAAENIRALVLTAILLLIILLHG